MTRAAACVAAVLILLASCGPGSDPPPTTKCDPCRENCDGVREAGDIPVGPPGGCVVTGVRR